MVNREIEGLQMTGEGQQVSHRQLVSMYNTGEQQLMVREKVPPSVRKQGCCCFETFLVCCASSLCVCAVQYYGHIT